MIFETAGKNYWKFDANDQSQAPDGYVLRTNFSMNGGGKGGLQRYKRTNSLIEDFYSGDSLGHKSIIRYQMRDLVDKNNQKVSILWEGKWGNSPQGLINCSNSICRPSSIGAAVFHGVSDGEPAKYTTMWTIIGQPAASVALPFWPVGEPPKLASHTEKSGLYNITDKIKSLLFDYRNKNYINSLKLKTPNNNGLWDYTYKVEDQIFNSTKQFLNNWRTNGVSKKEMLRTEKSLLKRAFNVLKKGYRILKKSA